ncbi:MAG: polysaccharide pyruvyl transferase family protein [Candidatus Saccharibacteria bacterium]|nr:polysaccharide pyruvyl transferase family protein [Candidatus Saccharibacteria bacterium]
MKYAILTHPLLNNYGGLLQNYALQQILKKMGQEPVTIDYVRIVASPLRIYILSWCKSLLYFFLPGKKRIFSRYSTIGHRRKWSEAFVERYIDKTKNKTKLSNDDFNGFDGIIVGSDQVWRPRYVYNIRNYFLDFINKTSVKKVAYAASFGVDEWEYSKKLTRQCSVLAKKFDAISVRESSGVRLCKEHLDVDATYVLDPTLLLTKDVYCELCKEISVSHDAFLAAYVLDLNDAVRLQCESIAKARGLQLIFFDAGKNASLTVPEWVAMFRDASYVVTDSFHGTVFSIIFGKEFKCLYNKSRGSARFESLLKLYESGKLDEMREFSLNWLKKSLES